MLCVKFCCKGFYSGTCIEDTLMAGIFEYRNFTTFSKLWKCSKDQEEQIEHNEAKIYNHIITTELTGEIQSHNIQLSLSYSDLLRILDSYLVLAFEYSYQH